MALVYSYISLDMRDLDFNRIWVGAFDSILVDDADLTFEGRTYRDAYVVDWTYGGGYMASVFGGQTLTANASGDISGGTVTGYLELYWNGYSYEYAWGMQDIAIGANRISAAVQSSSTADDFQLIEDALSGDDQFRLGFGNDFVSGFAGDDRMQGRGGQDILLGGQGNDSIMGGGGSDGLGGEAGDDLLMGQSGSDVLALDAGNDRLDGGSGRDSLLVWGSAGVTISLSWTAAQNTGYGRDTITGIEDVTGDRGEDRLSGSMGANLLDGRAGDDQLNGRAGADRVIAGGGDDLLLGGADHDQLRGGSGADTLDGGRGRDLMHAGIDARIDVFLFSTTSSSLPGRARDRIEAFDSGEDILDLRQIDANSAADGNQRFRFSSDGAASHAVWVEESGANLLLRADVNGDQRADFEIALLALNDLVTRDILL